MTVSFPAKTILFVLSARWKFIHFALCVLFLYRCAVQLSRNCTMICYIFVIQKFVSIESIVYIDIKIVFFRLFGCYEALDGGELAEALEDFTGGVSESFDMADEHYAENEEKKQEFYDWLKKSLDRGSLICAAIPVCCSSTV